VYITGTTAGVVDYLAFFDHWLLIAMAVVLSLIQRFSSGPDGTRFWERSRLGGEP
jgi:hypothetical protein